MKNTLSIDRGLNCTCVDSVADDTNKIYIEITLEDATNPRLVISKNGTVQSTTTLTANSVNTVDIPTALFTAGVNITFQYLDNSYSGEVFTIKFPQDLTGNLIIDKISDFVFTAKYTSQINPVITIDDALSSTSTNPVQNKVVKGAIDNAGLLPEIEIPANKNLNTMEYCNVGRYYCPMNVTVATLTNCPTSNAFVMEVYSPLSKNTNISPTGSVYRVRKILDYKGNEYIQYIDIQNNTPNYHLWHEPNALDVWQSRPTDANFATMGNGRLLHYKATSSMTANKPNSDGHIIQLNWDNTNGYDSQLFIPNNTVYRHPMQYRSQNAGAWDKWHDILSVDTTGCPISSTSDDTVAKWREIASGVYYYNKTGCLIDQPSQYALLIHLNIGYEIRQLWLTQATGHIWHRGGNQNGWSGGWRKLWDNINIDDALSTTSGSPVKNSVITTALNGKQATLTTTTGTATWNTTYGGTASARGCTWVKYGKLVIVNVYDATFTTSVKSDGTTSIIASGLPKAAQSGTTTFSQSNGNKSRRASVPKGSTNLLWYWAGTTTANEAGYVGQLMYICE